MNKIFKVIWNHAAQRFDVVSELTKSHGKSSSTTDKRLEPSKTLLAISVVGSALLGGSQVMAATAVSGFSSVATSDAVTSTSAASSIAISSGATGTTGAYARGDNTVAIGNNATALAQYAIAIGENTRATGSAVVIGVNATATGLSDDPATPNPEDVQKGASGAVAIGENATVTTPKGSAPYSIAVGFKSYATGTQVGSVTLRDNSVIVAGSSTAIGAYANATQASVAVGEAADASVKQFATAVGSNSRALGDRASAFGVNAFALGEASLAVGRNALAQVNYATAVGQKTKALGVGSSAFGTDSFAEGGNSLAAGTGALVIGSSASNAVSIGYMSEAHANSTIAQGWLAVGHGQDGVAVGTASRNYGANSTAVGSRARSTGVSASAYGHQSHAVGENTTALGRLAIASGTNGIAIGQSSLAGHTKADVDALYKAQNDLFNNQRNLRNNQKYLAEAIEANNATNIAKFQAEVDKYTAAQPTLIQAVTAAQDKITAAAKANAIAIGTGAQALGVESISVGKGNVVTGNFSGAFGDPSLISGTGAYTLGNDNAVGSTSKNVGAFGNNNQIGATATYTDGKLQTANGLANEVAVENSRVVGNNNYINSSNTYVLGSGVGVKDDGITVMDTVENSVYLGNDSTITSSTATITAANAGSVKNLDKDGDAGATSTAGSKGTVSEAVVSTLTYGGFAGATSVGAVTVGSAGEERRIVNLAAGEISKTSTDAINGSQLYAVTEVIGKGINIQNNAGGDVANILPGEAIAFKDGNLTTANVTAVGGNVSVSFDVDKGTFNATTTGALVANTSDTGVATVADVANAVNAGYWKVGNGTAVVNNVNFGDDVRFLNGTNTTVTVAADGTDRTNITIDTDFSKLPTLNTTTANINNNGGTISVDVNTGVGSVNGDTGVASVNNGDTNKVANISNVVELVNNTGWNVFQDSDASANKKDLVVAGDNVVFAAGTNTTVSVETDAAKKTTTIKYDVDLSKVTTTPENTTLSVTNGAVGTPAEGGKLVNATTVADAINNSGWQTTLTDGTVETINPGDKVNYVNGTTTTTNVVKDATGNVNVSFEVNKQDVGVTTAGTATLEGTATNADHLVTAGDVMNTINNVFWKATSDTDGGKFATTGHTKSDAQVKAGDAVTFKAGEGLTIKQDGRNFTYAVAAGDVTSDTNVANVTTTLGKAVADATNGTVATVGDVADAINNSGWVTTTTAGDTVVVNPGDTVSYVDGTNTKANVVTNADGGVDVTFDVNTGTSSVTTDGKAEADVANGDVATITDVVNTINNVYWNTVAGNVTGTNGESTSDATAKVKAGDTVTHNAGQNIKIDQKGATFNISTTENVTFTNAVVNKTFSLGDVANTSAPVVNMTAVNASTPVAGDVTAINIGGSTITNLAPNLPETVSTGNATNSTTSQVAPTVTADQKTNAATLGDVLNAGWNLKTADQGDLDFVKPYDTVNFVNGVGTSVVSSTDGNVSNIQYNVNVDNSTTKITYVDATGGALTAETQPDGSVIYKDAEGNVYNGPVTSQITAVQPQVNGENVTGPVNLVDGNTTTVTNTPDGIKVEVNTGNTTVGADGKAAPRVPADADKVATVGDLVETINNVGWFTNSTTSTVTGTNTKISAGQAVNFEAGKNMEVTQKVDANGNVTYTYATADDVTFNSTKVGSTYTDAQGNVVNNAPITIGTTPEGKNVISNLNSTLPTTVSTGNKATSTTKVDAPVIAAGDMTNAATLGDVLNAGWNLKTADQGDLDFVKPYDTVNFVNGVGTSVVSSTNGNVSNIQYNVNVDGTTTEITYVTKVNGKDVPVYQHVDGNYYTGENGTGTKVETPVTSRISAILPKTQVNGNNVTGPVNLVNGDTTTVTNTPDGIKVEVNTGNTTVGTDGKAAPLAPEDANKVVTVGDIVNTINNVSWNAIAGKVAGSNGEVTGNASTPVKAGDTVTYNAGNNIKIEQTGTTFNISTTENVTFTNANVTNNLTVEGNTTVNNFTVNPNSTINMGGNTITNVSAGTNATDAVNVQQLTQYVTNATSAYNWTMTGNNNASNATAVGNQMVSFNNGTGTTAVVDGTNVTYNVNVDNTTTQITYVDANGNSVTKNADGTYSKADGTKVDAANVTSQVSVAFGDVAANATTGTVSTGDISPKVASTTDVANAINGSGWKTTDANGNTLVVNPGDTVNYVNGNGTTANITTSKDADGKDVVNVTFDVKTATSTTTNTNGSIATPVDGDSYVNATTLVNTVNSASWNVNAGAVEGTTGQSTYTAGDKVKAGDTVAINAGNNIVVSGSGKTINVATSMTPTFTTVQVGGSTGPVISADENGDVKVAKKDGSAAKITNVAAGTANNDAVNVSQLKGVANNINNKIDNVDKRARRGTAIAGAMGMLPQPHISGKSMFSAATTSYRGEQAVAVGYSRLSDNGKHIIKFSGSSNVSGKKDAMVGAAYGYQW